MENNHAETKKKIDLTYYRARFSQKFGAMIIDFVVFAILGLLLFMGAKGIVEATPKFYEINHNLEVAQVNSSLFIYSSDRDRVEDIVTYINYRKDMSSSEIETFLTTRIYDFFDSLPEYKEELTNEYLELISRSDLTYNNEPYFIKNENGEVVKNLEANIPIAQYNNNVYMPYIDNIGLAEFVIKTPNVLEYQKFLSYMLFFVEIPCGIVFSAIITFYVIPLIFWRGRKTLGRLSMRIGLLDSNNYNVKFWKFTLRFVIFLFLEVILSVATLGIPLIISLSMSAFSKKKQNFHDYMLGIIEIDTYGTKVFKDKFEVSKEENRMKLIDFNPTRKP